MYAVIVTGGKQYRGGCRANRSRVEKLEADPGARVKFDQS